MLLFGQIHVMYLKPPETAYLIKLSRKNKNSEVVIKSNITACSDKHINNSICVQNPIITAILELAFNTFSLGRVLVLRSLSRQLSRRSTSTSPIFICLLKKSIGGTGFRFVPLHSSIFAVSVSVHVLPRCVRWVC
jgi:hypothetical protein